MTRLHLAFIDDDDRELFLFRDLYEGRFRVSAASDPHVDIAIARLKEELKGAVPNLFVLDLYFPIGKTFRSGFTDRQSSDLAKVKDPLYELEKTIRKLESDFDRDADKGTELLRSAHSVVRRAEHLMKTWCDELGQGPAGGLELLKQLTKDYPKVPKVFYSAKARLEDAKDALAAGALDVIAKADETSQARAIGDRFEEYARWQPPAFIIRWLNSFGVKVGWTLAGPTFEISAGRKK